MRRAAVITLLAAGLISCHGSSDNPGSGRSHGWSWLHWRGPDQNGTSREQGLPETWQPQGANHLWQAPLPGRGTPVIANGRLYTLATQGEGADVVEALACLDADKGTKIWETTTSDFISDTIYNRYAIGSPALDAETGNVYVLFSPGIFACYTADGKLLWRHSMMEEFGRLTFPNGRTGSPLVDGDLVIIRGITGNWGAHGPAMDRLYAFDKRSGKLVWTSSPGEQPKDNSFALPVLAWQNGKRVLYTGDGSGNLVSVNARTGDPIWRYRMAAEGVNSSVVLYRDIVIAIHAAENLDTSETGRMIGVRVGAEPKSPGAGPALLTRSAEVWRNPLASFSSSPILAGDRVYLTNKSGELCSVNAATGEILWRKKLAPDQLHASPLYADGKLYVPMQNGSFYILRPSDAGAEELSKAKLGGSCLGAPAVANGKIYVQTTEALYCFGSAQPRLAVSDNEERKLIVKESVALQIVPSEILINPGERVRFEVRKIDDRGNVVQVVPSKDVQWAKFIPPTAKVISYMNADFDSRGELVAADSKMPSAGAFQATVGSLKGVFRGRILPNPPISEDFSGFALPEVKGPAEMEPGVKFAYPPLSWNGARFRWEVRELDGKNVLAKTLDNVFFQRATTFIGGPDSKNYTIEADVMSDGNKRMMSNVGLINQRYLISLLGNAQELQISSNEERLKASRPFRWSPKTWYRLKARVDVAADGSGLVRAKAWKTGDPEPADWTVEARHKHAHANGSPGIFGYSLQSMFRIYIADVSVRTND